MVLVIFFFPKAYIKGGLGGEVIHEENRYKEEYNCFGIKHSYYPKGCLDCGYRYNCYGIRYGKNCFIEKLLLNDDVSKEPTKCK